MIAETGHYALILALAVAIVQTVLPLLGARMRDPQLAAVAAPAAQMQFVLVAIAFIALTVAYVTSDFSVENVWRNSHSAKPLIYKISGVWGNHEGSMLLWVAILAFYGLLVASFGGNIPLSLKANVLAVQAWITLAFLIFVLVTSNPFARLARAHQECPEQRQRERENGEQHRPDLQGLALLHDHGGMQERSPGEPGHQRGILDRIPEPPAAPAQLIICPPGSKHNTNGQTNPGRQRPGPHPSGPGGIDPTFNQSCNGKGKGNRKADIAHIEEGRVNGEGEILQNRIEPAAVHGRLRQTLKRIGSEDDE